MKGLPITLTRRHADRVRGPAQRHAASPAPSATPRSPPPSSARSSPTTWSGSTWSPGRRLARPARRAVRPAAARPRRAVLHYAPGDLRGPEGLPARRRLGLDVPAARPTPRASPRRPAGWRCPSCPRRTSSASIEALVAHRRGVGARPARRRRLYLRPFMYRLRDVPRRAARARGRVPRDRLAGRARTSPAASSPSRSGSRRTTTARAPAARAPPSAAATTPRACCPQQEAYAQGCEQVLLPRRRDEHLARGARRDERVRRARRRPRVHARAVRHDPRGRHALVDHPAAARRRSRGRRASAAAGERCATGWRTARSPRCSPAARPPSSRPSVASPAATSTSRSATAQAGAVTSARALRADRHPVRPGDRHARLAAPPRLTSPDRPDPPVPAPWAPRRPERGVHAAGRAAARRDRVPP